MTEYNILSPAKLNLHLQILPLRPDGFHGLQSLFQLVSLADEIRLRISSPGKDPFSCRIEGPFDFPAEKNHIYKAAALFAARTQSAFSLSAFVDKKIPEKGGLGGGSGNAAAVLKVLNSHFGNPLDPEALSLLGAEIGSDVPFFFSGGAALVRGRGEQIYPIEVRRDLFIVLVQPSVSVNTAEAFRLWDSRNPDPEENPRQPDDVIISAYRDQKPAQWGFENSFFNVLVPSYPVLAEIREILYSEGSDYANLTGSGSCLFGMFTDRENAQKAVGSLKPRYPGVKMITPVEAVN